MKIMLGIKKRGNQQQIVALSPVIDYMLHPKKHKDICLCNWIRLHYKAKMDTRKKKTLVTKKSSMDVECDSDFENDYDVYDKLNIIYKQASNLQKEAESYIIEIEESSDFVTAN